MAAKFYFICIIAILPFFWGCSYSYFLIAEDIPAERVGFLGIKWGAPMSFVEEHFSENATHVPEYSSFDISSFSHVNFLDLEADLSQFFFSPYGFLTAIELYFPEKESLWGSDFGYLADTLTQLYGNPVEYRSGTTYIFGKPCIADYVWHESGIELALLADKTIFLHSCKYIPGPPSESGFRPRPDPCPDPPSPVIQIVDASDYEPVSSHPADPPVTKFRNPRKEIPKQITIERRQIHRNRNNRAEDK